jgi:hypothetical protein
VRRKTGRAIRTLFGAVHDVGSISGKGRFVGLLLERLARELDELVPTIAAGGGEAEVLAGWVVRKA